MKKSKEIIIGKIDNMEKELLFKKKRVDREPVVPGSFHIDFKVVGVGRIRSKFRKQGIPAIKSIGKRKGFEYHLARFVHHGSDMVIFTDINANKKHRATSEERF